MSTPPTLSTSNYPFTDVPLTCTIYVPKGTSDLYKAGSGWKNFTNYVEFTIPTYNLTYYVDGKVYAIETYEEGDKITPLTSPTKEGYTFSGWSEIPATMGTANITVTGTFSVNSYTITYVIGGSTYKTETYQYGATITPLAAPTKEGYTFSGWSEIPATMGSADITVTGTFAVNSYTITYVVDGSTYKTETYQYGATITPLAAPTKEGYTFSGWSEIPATMGTTDITVTGTFSVNSYTITYVVDGSTYKTETYQYGATITPLAAPTKTGYTFSGWSEIPSTMPAENVTVTGTFTKDENQGGGSGDSDSGSGSGSTDISTFDNVIYASDATSSAGAQLELEFNLKNAASISDLQFDLYLPTGVTVATDEDDFALIDIATDRTTAKKHSVDYQEQADGAMRIMCTSSKGYTFDGNDGAVLIVTLNMADDLEEGDYDITLKNIVMSNSEESFQVSKVVSTLTISNYTIGDVNADGLINVADLSKLVKMILNSTEVSDNTSKAGDINCDNTLNVADYSKLVQMILNAPSSNAKTFTGKFEAKRTASSAYLEAEPVNITAGQEQQVAVLLSNSDVTANGIQMDIVLPEGLSIDTDNIATAARAKGFDIIFNGNRLILCDIKGSNFDGNDGTLFYLPVKADENLMSGSSSIMFSNVVLSDSNCESVSVSDFQIPVEVSQATGINGAMMFGNLAITTGRRMLTVQATAEQNVVVRSIDGKLVSSKMLNRGEKEVLYLASGVYMINNNKVIIK